MTSPDPATAVPTRDPAPKSRQPLVRIGICAVVWCLALALLAWCTANPVTVNQRQVRRADVVIGGRVNSVADGKVTVTDSWRGGPQPGTDLVIPELAESPAEAGGEYVFPLWETPDDGYKIVLVPAIKSGADPIPAVYPLSANVSSQVLEALARGRIED